MVSRLLLELQNEVECFMLRMAAIFPQRKEQLIYMINNYDLILGILMERTRDNTKEAESFKEQLAAKSGEYVEEILGPHIGGIIHFVKDCEQMIEKEQVCLQFIFYSSNLIFMILFYFRWRIIAGKSDVPLL